MIITDTHKVQKTAELVLTEDEVLSEFAAVMAEWGHYKTASGLRYPTQAEVQRVADRWCGGRV